MNKQPKPITREDRKTWITHCTGFFIEALGGAEADKRDAINLALKRFDEGASAAAAVYQGYDLIRKRQFANQCLIAVMQTWRTLQ
ncbi:MAG: hypothetical protein ACU841_16575 [Gammaproteobacteria bacterium]